MRRTNVVLSREVDRCVVIVDTDYGVVTLDPGRSAPVRDLTPEEARIIGQALIEAAHGLSEEVTS